MGALFELFGIYYALRTQPYLRIPSDAGKEEYRLHQAHQHVVRIIPHDPVEDIPSILSHRLLVEHQVDDDRKEQAAHDEANVQDHSRCLNLRLSQIVREVTQRCRRLHRKHRMFIDVSESQSEC